jgi:hypothetical protein
LISNQREDRQGVFTDALTVLEIAKVFDELSPSSSEQPNTVENEDERIVRLTDTITRSYEPT